MVEGKHGIGRILAAAAGLALCLAQAHAAPSPFALSGNTPLAADGAAGSLGLEGLAYEIAAAPGFEGQEALLLQARLQSGGGLINRPIQWRVSRLSPLGGQELVAVGESAAFALPASPGDYRVEISYGLASLVQNISLPRGEQQTLTFILDMGGLRVLSKLETLALPPGMAMLHRIYAEDGPNLGRLIAQTAEPGDMLRLPAGRYKVESEIGPGNALAETSVTIKPGVLSTLEIGHKVGVARFALKGDDDAWTVRDIAGRVVAQLGAGVRELILNPGTYRVEKGEGSARRFTAFTIAPGQSLGVSLPE